MAELPGGLFCCLPRKHTLGLSDSRKALADRSPRTLELGIRPEVSSVFWGISSMTYLAPIVAQVSNLLYRRFPIGNALKTGTCSLAVVSPAGWKPALRHRIYAVQH